MGSKGIRQLPLNWCTFPMIIYKLHFCRLQLVIEKFEHLMNQPIRIQEKSPTLESVVKKKNLGD